MSGTHTEIRMQVTLALTLDEYSWLREAMHQMNDDIPHLYCDEDSERMLHTGRAIARKFERIEQEQVYTH